ncbi:MAG: protein kinase [Catenulisporales bacterium]|nr:protein kinase [Catenulisporales bacterium]
MNEPTALRCDRCGDEASADANVCSRCGSPLQDPLLGAVLSERYRIIERLGIGGMGVVYRAEHLTLKRDVAVKVLLPEFGGKDEFVRRFEREAESASRLSHPNIINVLDFGRTPDGLLFLTMEFLAGPSLTDIIRSGPLPVPRALGIIRQMLRALGHAHESGVVHRDLKPDNIMLVERDGQSDFVKILDFGIAKVSEPASGGEALTQAGVIFGTPEYLSPEQALGEGVDARADLYAAGVILFEMLTGRRPFESEDKVKIISMHLAYAPPKFVDVRADLLLPLSLQDVVHQALDKHREYRFASAAAFLMALQEAEMPGVAEATAGDLTGPTIASPAAAAVPPVLPRTRGRTIGAVALVLLLAGGGAFALLGRSSPLKSAPPTAPAPAPPSLARKLSRVEELLAAGEEAKAHVALEQIHGEHPDDARVHYYLGRLAFLEDRHTEALAQYREALKKDGGYRGDPVLLGHLGEALGESRSADAALDLAVTMVGKPAVPLLVRVANESADVHRRERAAAALDDLGEGGAVDRVGLTIVQLKAAGSCEERKPFVVRLGELRDTRALPALRQQRGRGGLGGLLAHFNREDNVCMKTELAQAITVLEAKLPPPQRASRRRGR